MIERRIPQGSRDRGKGLEMVGFRRLVIEYSAKASKAKMRQSFTQHIELDDGQIEEVKDELRRGVR